MIQKIENVLELEVTDGTEPVDFTVATNILLAISQKQCVVYIKFPVDVQDGKLVCTLPYKSAMRLVSATGAAGEAAGGTIVLHYMPHELVGNYFMEVS